MLSDCQRKCCQRCQAVGHSQALSGVCCQSVRPGLRPASLREGMSLPRFDPAAKSCSLEPRPTLPSRLQLLSSPEDRCLICCLPAVAAGEPCGPLYYKGVLTRCPPAIFYPHDSERECDRTIGSFSLQSGITREQLSLPLASPPSPSGIRGILWVVQSIDLPLPSCTTGILTINQNDDDLLQVQGKYETKIDGLAHPGVVRPHINPRR